MRSFEAGDKIWFEEEVQGYRIMAKNERYLICTKPFNVRRTVLYTIVDLEELVRGPDDLVFGFYLGYETKEACEEALEDLIKGEMEISHRRRIELKIRKVKQINNLRNKYK